jgi:uncharacterized SAM-binding protein YcdF (DUF218 family)
MATSTSNPRRSSASGSSGFARLLRLLFSLALLATILWTVWVYLHIDAVAREDHAQPSDAIAVFGAAEYSGRPSPVFHARLDHAVQLYRKQIAPVIITLGGGSDRDSGKTEGGVGRDYLLANGIPFERIIAETRSIDTEQQVHRLAAIARENNFHTIVVVSDPTHLFRIQELCQDSGLDVLTSPRPSFGNIGRWDLAMRYAHEIVSYTSLRLHLNGSALHRWMEGKNDD